MVSIIDYKMGNIRSVENALAFLGAEYKIVNSADEILNSEKIILPGVGSFKQAMNNIHELKLFDAIKEAALEKRMPILGICLGMQLLADSGEEDGYSEGLGLVPGKIVKMESTDISIKIPHVGFNSVTHKIDDPLFLNLNEVTDFYFVHSYKFVTDDEGNISSVAKHGDEFTASVRKDNIFGTQFHPEKSQGNGLTLLKNFIKLEMLNG